MYVHIFILRICARRRCCLRGFRWYPYFVAQERLVASLLSQLMFQARDVTILHNFPIFMRARIVFHMNDTDIRMSCFFHPLIVDCLLASPTF